MLFSRIMSFFVIIELRRRNVQTTNPPSKPSGPLVPIHASSNGYSMPPAPRLRSIQAPGIRAPVGMMRGKTYCLEMMNRIAI